MSNVSTINRFPLLRLSQIALQEVLKPMNPFELIDLSKTSSRTKQAVKSFLNTRQCKREYKIQLNINNSEKISIEGTYNYYTYQFESDQFPEFLVLEEVLENEEVVILFSENIVNDFKELLEHVLDIFNSGITTLGLYGLLPFCSTCESVIDWLKCTQKPIKCLVTRLDGIAHKKKDVYYVLNSLIITDSIRLVVLAGNLFQPIFPPLSRQLYIANGNWITLSQLLKFNCPIIQLGFSTLTNQDINKFLSSWINLESHMNLKFFKTGTNKYGAKVVEICNGLEIKITDPKVKTFDVHFMEGPAKVEIVGGIDIRRNDGVTATLSLYVERGRTYFIMIIN